MTSQPHSRRYAIGPAEFSTEALQPGLHIVATPIGNLGDVTVRALATLAGADAILCEDTRTTAKLLERYSIRNRLSPYHEHNAAKVRPGLIARLKEGAALALVSDAGMPLVSDPGYRLVREAIAAKCPVTVCPGPSSVLAALALSGLPSDRFMFLGFMPQKAGERRKLMEELASLRATLVAFESPHRIVGTLKDIAAHLPRRPVAVARELTKLHEEVLRGDAAELGSELSLRAAIKGEITLVIGPPADNAVISGAELDRRIAEALRTMPASKVAAEIARRFSLNKSEVYARILESKK